MSMAVLAAYKITHSTLILLGFCGCCSRIGRAIGQCICGYYRLLHGFPNKTRTKTPNRTTDHYRILWLVLESSWAGAGRSFFINPFGYAFISSNLAAAFLFTTVVRMKEKHVNWINRLAENTFDVFFVHGKWLFQLLGIELIAGTVWMIPHIIVSIIISYLVGYISGWFRKILFNVSVDQWLNRVNCVIEI